jgi:hypothetical protein
MSSSPDDSAPAAQIQTTEVSPADESSNRAQIVRRLIKARAMLQESRNRSAELQGALERFKYAQAKIGER